MDGSLNSSSHIVGSPTIYFYINTEYVNGILSQFHISHLTHQMVHDSTQIAAGLHESHENSTKGKVTLPTGIVALEKQFENTDSSELRGEERHEKSLTYTAIKSLFDKAQQAEILSENAGYIVDLNERIANGTDLWDKHYSNFLNTAIEEFSYQPKEQILEHMQQHTANIGTSILHNTVNELESIRDPSSNFLRIHITDCKIEVEQGAEKPGSILVQGVIVEPEHEQKSRQKVMICSVQAKGITSMFTSTAMNTIGREGSTDEYAKITIWGRFLSYKEKEATLFINPITMR